jgi:hypothetical protein
MIMTVRCLVDLPEAPNRHDHAATQALRRWLTVVGFAAKAAI